MDAHVVGLGALRPGDHLCFPYESDEDKGATLLTFVRDGLARHERCLYIGAPTDQGRLVDHLAAAGVRVQQAIERGALVLATYGETYLRTGRFDGDDMLDLLDRLVDRALGDGYAGLRATGEGSTKPLPDELWSQILRYEAMVTERFARRPFTALCRLSAAHSSPARVQDLLRTHPLALVRGELCANPFYEPADLVFSDDGRARLDWQLHQLRAHARWRRRLQGREGVRQSVAEGASPGERCDLVALVREIAERHGAALGPAACRVSLEAARAVEGAWDPPAVEEIISTLLLGAAARGAGRAVKISVVLLEDRARLTFDEDRIGGQVTVELPRARPGQI